MAVSPQKFRELVLQLLYSEEVGAASEEAMSALMAKELSISQQTVAEAQEIMRAIRVQRDIVDVAIRDASMAYEFERIGSVERAVLRLGVYELLVRKKLPPKIIFAEMIRLARKFSTPEATTFINAVLDAIYRRSEGLPPLPPKEVVDASEALRRSEEHLRELLEHPGEFQKESEGDSDE